MDKKGWIALDIDGTITLDKYSVPQPVTDFLGELSKEGWGIVMATGRPLTFASLALHQFYFPFIFLVQNGSAAVEQPSAKPLFKRYMTSDLLELVEAAYEGIPNDFLIYAGYEKGDFCYWRRHKFTEEGIRYLEDVQMRQKEKWVAVDSFCFNQLDDFPLIKCFGSVSDMEKVAERLKRAGKFQVANIRDPFAEGVSLLLVTDQAASKGNSLLELFRLKGRGPCVIAAGDDENDKSLLAVADIKIAMAHAPASLQEMATLIAPPTQELGIIQALKMAIRHV